MELEAIINKLLAMSNERNVEGMRCFGIVSKAEILGVPKPKIRELARNIGMNHDLALKLWETGIHEARILATLIADPSKITDELIEKWIKDVDNWDLCDQLVMNLLWKTKIARKKILEWCNRNEEFVKRAGFVLIAKLAISDKKSSDEEFEKFFPLIKEGAKDSRKYVYKAVSWALRQIGKRNPKLNEKALKLAEEIMKLGTKSARYVAREALKELKSEKVKKRLMSKQARK